MCAEPYQKVARVQYVPHIVDVDAFQEHFRSPPRKMKSFHVVNEIPSEKMRNDNDKSVLISPEQSTVNQAVSQMEDERKKYHQHGQKSDSFTVVPPAVSQIKGGNKRKRGSGSTKVSGKPSKVIKKSAAAAASKKSSSKKSQPSSKKTSAKKKK